MAVSNELLQGIIAALIVALVVVLCCLFYWCKIRKEKAERNIILEHVLTERQIATTDGRLQPKVNKSQEDQWYRQERKRRLQQIVSDHHQRDEQPHQGQLRQYKQLDLHKYTLREAMEAFDLFLVVSLDDYNETEQAMDRFVDVITGRGKHSKDGVPVIKMNVSDYLVKHCYTHSWPNPGMTRIDLFSKTQAAQPSQTSGQKSLRQKLTCNVM